MVSRDTVGSRTETDRDAFAATLTRLKQRGASLLIVGDLPAGEYSHICARMSGDETATRRRLFVTTAANLPAASERFSESGGPSPETAALIRWHGQTRSTAPPVQPAPTQLPTVDVQCERLPELGITISEEIATFDLHADGLAPAELRVCFDSLATILSTYDHEAVFRFLHVLISRIRSVQGIGHFHLPLAMDAESVRLLAPLFDAMIELRLGSDHLRQRWHLREPDLTSAWLPVTTRS